MRYSVANFAHRSDSSYHAGLAIFTIGPCDRVQVDIDIDYFMTILDSVYVISRPHSSQ